MTRHHYLTAATSSLAVAVCLATGTLLLAAPVSATSHSASTPSPTAATTPKPTPSPTKTIANPTGGWQAHDTATPDYFDAVAVPDSLHFWAAAVDGVFASTDGGLTWAQQPLPVADFVTGIAFSDAQRGWAVGTGGIVGTTDGGAIWTVPTQDPMRAPTAVTTVDATHAWAVGADGAILATTDGGTWTVQSSGTSATLLAVDFADTGHGWAVGHGGTILATTDGGATWTPQDSGGTATLDSVSFVDATHGWAAGYVGGGSLPYGYLDRRRALLLSTSDGGATWTPRYDSAKPSMFAAIRFTDTLHGRALAPSFDGGVYGAILATSDGGTTWDLQGTDRQWLLGLACVDDQTAVAVGMHGAIRATVDGGASLDTTAPVTTAKCRTGWSRTPVRLRFSAVDDAAGSGVSYTEYRIGDGVWKLAPGVVAAPLTHGNDGLHVVHYRALDMGGNVETAKAVTVRIDTRRPRIAAVGTASCDNGRAHVTFSVNDPAPSAGWTKVMIDIMRNDTDHEALAQRVVVGRVGNGTRTVGFDCGLAPGTYGFWVYGKDAAGNTGWSAKMGTLVVT